MENHEPVGLTRRETLKRGAKLGGAVLWMTPVVQAVGMRPAFAQRVSPGACDFWYAIKIERVGNTTAPRCLDITGGSNPPGQCLDVGAASPEATLAGGCGHITTIVIAPEDALDDTWRVTLEEGCEFREGSGRCTVKLGDNQGGCEPDPGDPDVCDWDPATRVLSFTSSTGTDISHVEFVFCCDHEVHA